MAGDVTPNQLFVLRWIAEGCPDDGRWPNHNGHKAGARALANRKLVHVSNGRRGWAAEITPAGTYYLEHGNYPPDHRRHNLDLTPVARRTEEEIEADTGEESPLRPGRPRATQAERPDLEFEIDSPRRTRQREDASKHGEHPWEDRVLVSAKEAAWVLSVSVDMIRAAVKDGDLQRVFIGQGTTNYRIVYQSLLAWVDSMPRESLRDY